MTEKQDHRLQLRITSTAYARLNEIRISKGFPSMSVTGRDAVRHYIEQQSGQSSSHFNRTVEQRLQALEEILLTQFSVEVSLQAILGAAILTVLDEDEKEWKAAEIIAEAARVALQQHSYLKAMLQQLIQAQRQAETQREA